jgi:hypothetical protein
MTDAALTKLCEKKVREAIAKYPKDARRVLTALFAAVSVALAKEQ